MADKVAKGRQTSVGGRKLSDRQILEIRESTETESLARRFGVSVGTIRNARHGRTYGKVLQTPALANTVANAAAKTADADKTASPS
jgi:DNA-binding transcriptional regulator YiaG